MVILSFCTEIVLCKSPDCMFGNSNLESVRLAGEWIKYSGISKSSTKPESQGGRLQTEKSSFQYLRWLPTPSKIKRWASIAKEVSSLLCPVSCVLCPLSCVTMCHPPQLWLCLILSMSVQPCSNAQGKKNSKPVSASNAPQDVHSESQSSSVPECALVRCYRSSTTTLSDFDF